MIRKPASREYRLYSREKNPATGKRGNPGTFKTRAAAQKHERDVQYFKRHCMKKAGRMPGLSVLRLGRALPPLRAR